MHAGWGTHGIQMCYQSYIHIHIHGEREREDIFIPFQFYGKLKTDLKRNVFSFFTHCYFPIASKRNSGSMKANYNVRLFETNQDFENNF